MPVTSAGLSADELVGRREYEAFMQALTTRTDEQAAAINARWRSFEKAAQKRAADLRRQMNDAITKVRIQGGVLSPETADIFGLRAELDSNIWTWLDKEFNILHLRKSRASGALEINNRGWNPDKGSGATFIDDAVTAGGEAAGAGAAAIRKATLPDAKKTGDAFESGAEDAADDIAGGQGASWLDNIIRSLEGFAYSLSAAAVDATSAFNAEAAIAELATLADPVTNRLELSFTTHPRAAYRATVAAAGRAIDAEKWLYYLPPDARVEAAPSGFGASQHMKIRSTAGWEDVRQGLDHTRPGSYAFSTGFHAGDRGVLLPIPPFWAKVAQEVERRRRQEWLESQAGESA